MPWPWPQILEILAFLALSFFFGPKLNFIERKGKPNFVGDTNNNNSVIYIFFGLSRWCYSFLHMKSQVQWARAPFISSNRPNMNEKSDQTQKIFEWERFGWNEGPRDIGLALQQCTREQERSCLIPRVGDPVPPSPWPKKMKASKIVP